MASHSLKWGVRLTAEPNKLTKEPRQLRAIPIDRSRYNGEYLRHIRGRVFNRNGELQR